MSATTQAPVAEPTASPTPFTPGTARIGFIGLGNMGSGMTRNLQAAGFRLLVNDVRKDAAAELLANGAEWADTAAAVAAGSDVVITMLPTPKHVEAVAMAAGGILEGLPDGGTWVDMSTSVPDVANRVREAGAARGIRIIDAPVSGMSVGAANGMLQIFVGGDAADVERLRPVFEAMGDPERILHVGGHGAGYAVKLMINQLWFSHLVATAGPEHRSQGRRGPGGPAAGPHRQPGQLELRAERCAVHPQSRRL
jgi:3-hydroxyisobutyrate dehydrogenase